MIHMFRKDIICFSTMRITSCMRFIIFMLIFDCQILSCLRNFALRKSAYQSSTENDKNFNWTADKAVDGNTDGSNPGTSRTCSKTDIRMETHTWEVDIGFMFIVNHVVIYERSDGLDQLSGFLVIIGNHTHPWRGNMALEKTNSTRYKYILYADDTLARFVSVIRQKKETMTLCEVEVYGECLDGMYSEFCNRTCGQCSNGEPCNKDTGGCLSGCEPGWTGLLCNKGLGNFALKKSAYQSSTFNYRGLKWTADKAVDGNTDGSNLYLSMTCSLTDIRLGNHTWEVDIGFLIIVNHVVIYERSDTVDEPSGFQVFIGNHSNPWNANKPLQKKQLSQFRYRCIADNSIARFVSVILQNVFSLSLCEVEVYGECLDGMFSEFCNSTCGHCSNGEPCNKDTGECLRGCEPGWTGILCDKGLRNFALKKSAYQSSTWNYNGLNWTADKAVDGNTNGSNPYTSTTCSETEIRMGTHTWEVDIGFLFIVNHVVIYERSDTVDDISGFQVFIGNHSNPWNANKPLQKKQLSQFRYQCIADNSLARFVSVIRQNEYTMTLCEVEVYGECSDGMFSEFCNHTCGHCSNGEPCNKDTGECLRGCDPGWTGLLCDKDSSAKLTITLSREDMTVIGGSVAGACVGSLIISVIIIAFLKKGRNTDTGDPEMEMNETGVSREESFGDTAVKEIWSPSDYNVASLCIPTTTATRDDSEYADAQITEAEYEELQYRGRIESSIYCTINGTETEETNYYNEDGLNIEQA